MPEFSPPEGLLSDTVGDLTDLPSPIAEAILGTVEAILGPTGPNIGDPQPANRPIPANTLHELNSAVKAINTALSAINLVLKLGFLLPPQITSPLQLAAGALRTIRSWLD